MQIELIDSTGDIRSARKMIEFGSKCARMCYTEKDWHEIQQEPVNEGLLINLINNGHHSVFEHMNLTFSFDGIPKALAMVFNNEKQYATSEKSARYTVMSGMEPMQKRLYDKWMERLIPKIDKVYPRSNDADARSKEVRKLAQENARYMSSVFTLTKMIHTINLRQLNFLQQQFEKFSERYSDNHDCFESRLVGHMRSFLEQTKEFRMGGLDNQTERKLSLFSRTLTPSVERSDMYSAIYFLSFAGLAQAHRHRTISYNILGGTALGAENGFFTPPIVEDAGFKGEWIDDLRQVAESDFPQAQLLQVYERGRLEDFRSKALLRICGHAQLEIMRNTLETALDYTLYQHTYGDTALKPKCMQEIRCASPCVWSGKGALERLV